MAIQIMLNIVTALVTDGDNPAKMANSQSSISRIMALIALPFLRYNKGLNKMLRIHNIMPTCKPETAKI